MADKEEKRLTFAVPKENYKHLLIGFAVVVIGYILMIGGGSDDPNVFSWELFSFRRITLAPVVVLAGLVYIMWAIMRKPKGKTSK